MQVSTRFRDEWDDILVSTVCIHNFHEAYYETMIFGLFDDEYQERCYTLDEAKEQHEKALKLAKSMT